MSPKKVSSSSSSSKKKKKISMASPRTTRRENESGTSLMSPRYCPPQESSSTKSVKKSNSTTKYPRQAPRQKTVYTNFSRAPRFSWQKHSKLTKNIPDITHKSRLRNHGTSPSPCSYNVPTSFSPYTEEKRSEEERRRRSETKNSSPSVSKKLNLDDVSVEKGPPLPGDFEEEDEVSEFVKSSVKGKTFKMWESSSPSGGVVGGEWKDKQGYSRSGRWVTVRSKEDRKQKSKRKGIAYMAKMQNTTFDQQNLSRLFDQIDVNGDKAVSGEELRNFLHEERDRPAGKALLKYVVFEREHFHFFHNGLYYATQMTRLSQSYRSLIDFRL